MANFSLKAVFQFPAFTLKTIFSKAKSTKENIDKTAKLGYITLNYLLIPYHLIFRNQFPLMTKLSLLLMKGLDSTRHYHNSPILDECQTQ